MADHISFCPKCGIRMPEAVPVPPPAPKPPRAKGLWIALIAGMVVCALLIGCTAGVLIQNRKLNDQIEDLQAQLAAMEEHQLSIGTLPTDPTGTTPSEPLPSGTVPADPEPTEGRPSDSLPTDPAPTAPTTPPLTQATEPPSPPITISVWAPYEDQIKGNSWLEEMQLRFESQYPQYEIIWNNGNVSEGDATFLVNQDVRAAADIYMFASDQLYNLNDAGGLTRLGGQYLEQVCDDNSSFAIDTVTNADGGVYGFPISGNTWFLYYNKDVFTAEDVTSLDTMLSKGKVCVPFNIGWNSGCFFLGTGCTVFGPNGNDASAGIDFSGEKGYTAARKMLEIASHPNCVPGGMDISRLIDGEVDAVFSGSWDASRAMQHLGDKLGAARLPSFEADGTTYNMTALSGSKCVGVNPNAGSDPLKLQLCLDFAAFLASEEGQLLRYEMRGMIPICIRLNQNPQIQSDPVAIAELETLAYCSVVQPSLPGMNNYWAPVETFGKGCVNGDISIDNYQEQVNMLNQALNNSGL